MWGPTVCGWLLVLRIFPPTYLKELNLESLQDKCKTLQSFWNQLIKNLEVGNHVPVASTPKSSHMGNAQQEPNPEKWSAALASSSFVQIAGAMLAVEVYSKESAI